MIKILFTGVGRRVELIQAFREAALVLNKELKIYGADMNSTAPALVYCDYQRHVPHMRDKTYIQSLLDICSKERIDLVIPTIDTDLLVLSENKKRFEAVNIRVLISDADKIRICRDKNLTFQFFTSNCSLHAPKTVSDWKEYNAGYPAFIKPKDGSSSINAYRVENEEELRLYASRIEGYIIQPFIKGQEYTIDIFCDWEGKPIYIVPRERLQIRAGEVLKTRIDLDQKLIGESQKLCEHFNPCGPMAVQVIRDEAGTDCFIEINPRFGGGSPLSMKAGAKSAEAILKLLDGEEVDYNACGNYGINDEINCGIENGAIYSRFDQSVCLSCLSDISEEKKLKGVIFDLDDTLYTEKEYVKSGFKAVSDYLGGGYEDKLWNYFLKDNSSAIDKLLFELGREFKKPECLKIYRTHKPNIHLYPDVLETIRILKHRGIKIGIITDGRPEGQRNKLDALGLLPLIDDIIITDELGGSQFRKPCDVAFRLLLNRWQLPANEIAYVGDNIAKDFQAPSQLGMKSIWFRNEDGLYYTKDDVSSDIRSTYYTIDSITELQKLLPPRNKVKFNQSLFF